MDLHPSNSKQPSSLAPLVRSAPFIWPRTAICLSKLATHQFSSSHGSHPSTFPPRHHPYRQIRIKRHCGTEKARHWSEMADKRVSMTSAHAAIRHSLAISARNSASSSSRHCRKPHFTRHGTLEHVCVASPSPRMSLPGNVRPASVREYLIDHMKRDVRLSVLSVQDRTSQQLGLEQYLPSAPPSNYSSN